MVLDLSSLKKKVFGIVKTEGTSRESYEAEGYIEISPVDIAKYKNKVKVKVFVLNEFSDVKKILDAIREGYSICFVDIRPLKDKDFVELKRAIEKIKKTVEAIEGDLAGIGMEWLIVTPAFAEIYRPPKVREEEVETSSEEEEKS